ncbi:hypothetical protein [Moraxella sp.]|uniref:hypothetical protein n=1 Tax=Moraxella sp. TaxID=479 RepID=UPI002608B192|nr:hypothetical protein [Moraxella sp.]MCP3898011.1 hypothetical protein [Moraxella sp.]
MNNLVPIAPSGSCIHNANISQTLVASTYSTKAPDTSHAKLRVIKNRAINLCTPSGSILIKALFGRLDGV